MPTKPYMCYSAGLHLKHFKPLRRKEQFPQHLHEMYDLYQAIWKQETCISDLFQQRRYKDIVAWQVTQGYSLRDAAENELFLYGKNEFFSCPGFKPYEQLWDSTKEKERVAGILDEKTQESIVFWIPEVMGATSCDTMRFPRSDSQLPKEWHSSDLLHNSGPDTLLALEKIKRVYGLPAHHLTSHGPMPMIGGILLSRPRCLVDHDSGRLGCAHVRTSSFSSSGGYQDCLGVHNGRLTTWGEHYTLVPQNTEQRQVVSLPLGIELL